MAVAISTDWDLLPIEEPLSDFAVGVAGLLFGCVTVTVRTHEKLGRAFIGVVFFLVENWSRSWLAGT